MIRSSERLDGVALTHSTIRSHQRSIILIAWCDYVLVVMLALPALRLLLAPAILLLQYIRRTIATRNFYTKTHKRDDDVEFLFSVRESELEALRILRQEFYKLASEQTLWQLIVPDEHKLPRFDRLEIDGGFPRHPIRAYSGNSSAMSVLNGAIIFESPKTICYAYPLFIIFVSSDGKMRIFSYDEITFTFTDVVYLEESHSLKKENILSRRRIKIHSQGKKVRYQDVPLGRYGALHLTNEAGHSWTMLADSEARMQTFAIAFMRYWQCLHRRSAETSVVIEFPDHEANDETFNSIVQQGAPQSPQWWWFPYPDLLIIGLIAAWFAGVLGPSMVNFSDIAAVSQKTNTAILGTLDHWRAAITSFQERPDNHTDMTSQASTAAPSQVTGDQSALSLTAPSQSLAGDNVDDKRDLNEQIEASELSMSAMTPLDRLLANEPPSRVQPLNLNQRGQILRELNVQVKVDVANLRASPSLEAEILSTATKGDILKVFERKNNWLQVGPRKPQGWIYRELVQYTSQ